MKKCAKCGSQYEDAYDGCPVCAAAATKEKRSAAWTQLVTSVAVLAVVIWVLWRLTPLVFR